MSRESRALRRARRLRRRPGRWPLTPVVPLLVAIIGIAIAVTIDLLAVGQLQATSDEAAALRSKGLAATLAARLRATPIQLRGALVDHTERASGARFVLCDQQGNILLQPPGSALDRDDVLRLLRRAEGANETALGRYRFAASSMSPPFENLSVVAFVEAPAPAEGTVRLSNAVGVLTLLLIGVAMAVALAFTRTARDDVVYVRHRIAEMARGGSESGVSGAGPVPLRSLDQVGLLTAALNNLIERFATAERGYRDDLRAAAQLDSERSQFLAGLSHELRTPLNAILGFTHLLESEDDGPLSVDAREALTMIRTGGEHLKSLIDDILDLSAMETGQLRLVRAVVDVHGLAEEVVREAAATVKDRPLLLRVEGMRNAFAWADPRRLRQVLTNLVSNALKATARGEVCLTIVKDRDMVQVSVRDSGRGIARDELEAIFEPYRQAGDAAARRGGAGLGLAIARRLVLLHGGEIRAQSEVGRGSVFTVTFPDETHATKVPRDSLVPWSDSMDALGISGSYVPPSGRTT
jgi:signal transduction histidine kinase